MTAVDTVIQQVDGLSRKERQQVLIHLLDMEDERKPLSEEEAIEVVLKRKAKVERGETKLVPESEIRALLAKKP